MARLHEYQGKEILAAHGFKLPRGKAAHPPDQAFAAAKELGGEVVRCFANLEYRLGDIEEPPIEKGTIDLAILSQTLHHAPHPERAIASAHRILKKGGSSFWTCSATASSVRASFTPTSGAALARCNCINGSRRPALPNWKSRFVSREKESPHFQTVFATGSK